MCKDHNSSNKAEVKQRRNFLYLAGYSTAALILASLFPTRLVNANPLPKPQNKVDPDQAIARLIAGNARYVNGVTRRHDFLTEREVLTTGQNPFAAVLGCADSRVPPEYAFDTARGDLFTVRVAGNFVTPNVLASLEYAVTVLGTPLIVVLGHERCGAVGAAIKTLKDGDTFPGSIQNLADAISPSVEKVMTNPGELLENAIAQNIKDTVDRLEKESALLADALAKKKLRVVGATYKLDSGIIEFNI